MRTLFNDGPDLPLRAMAIITSPIFHEGPCSKGLLKCEIKEGRSGVHGVDTGTLVKRILRKLHDGLTKNPRVCFDAILRTGGQLFIGRRKRAGLQGSGRTDLSEAGARAA